MNVYEIVTGKILAELEKGVVPWHKPWRESGEPVNIASKKHYRGINTILLGMAEYSNPWWGTYKQVQEAGGQVRKGEKSTLIVFWKPAEKKIDRETGEVKESFVMLRYYNVFNVEQCDNMEKFVPEAAPEPVSGSFAVEEVLENYSPGSWAYGGDRAFYSWDRDHIQMPQPKDFDSEADFAATWFHELVHSTGHPSRLKRDFSGGFGSSSYAREELVAEIGAAYLCEHYGIEYAAPSASYIASWMKRIKDDPKLIVVAAGKAAKAVDLMLGVAEEVEKVA